MIKHNGIVPLSIFIILQTNLLYANPFAYITDFTNNQVYVVDTATNTQIKAIDVAGGPAGVAATHDGTRVYVTCRNDDTVKYIDTTTNTVIGSISITTGDPSNIAITPNDTTAYVVVSGPAGVIPIDIATSTAGAIISAPALFFFQDIAITSDGTMAYITAFRLAITPTFRLYPMAIPANTLGTFISVPVGTVPSESFLDITPNNSFAYISNSASGTVIPVNLGTATAAAEVATGSAVAREIRVAPNGNTVYVAVQVPDGMVPLDISATPSTPSVSPLVSAGTDSFGIDITPTGSFAYVTNFSSSNMTPFNLASALAPSPGANITLTTSSGGTASPFLLTIISLPNITGTVKKNVFLNFTECILTITWTASTSSNIVSYNIYRGDTLIGNVLATNPSCFRTLFQCGVTYSVAAVNSSGTEGTRMPVEIV